VFRSDSNRPLFVTAIGVDESEARGCIKKMHGDHRLPTILKAVDRLCRDSYL
jgi:deoxyribonuclease V